MQTGGALQGTSTMPGRGWLTVLLAILAIAAMVALMVWVGPFGFGGVETREAVPVAPTAVVHDDPGSVHAGLAPGYAAVHDDAGDLVPAAGSVNR